jgi:phosphoglycolate phosphatase
LPDAQPGRTAVFDLDGVLADSTVPITSCLSRTLETLGYGPRPREALLGFIGPPARVGFAELTGEPPESPAIDACVRTYRGFYEDALWETPPFPGVPEALGALRDDGWRLGVATSKPARFAEPVLRAIGLRDLFAVVAGPQEDGTADKTATLGEALAELGGAVAMVGDRRFDMAAARVHGVRAVGVTWGFGSRRELLDAGAEVLIENPGELPGALA